MKKIILFVFLGIMTSCSKSGGLTKDEAKSIMTDCFNKQNKAFFNSIQLEKIKVGKNQSISEKHFLLKYKNLNDVGYIKLKKNENNKYDIELTEKIKDKIVDKDGKSTEIDIQSPPNLVSFPVGRMAMDVKKIQMSSNKDTANVEFTFKMIEKTELGLVNSENYDSEISKKTLKKEFRKSTEGWTITCKGF